LIFIALKGATKAKRGGVGFREELKIKTMENLEKIKNKTTSNSMRISSDRLLEFGKLFEQKTGIKLSEQEVLQRAETLLRTISLLYQPVSAEAYCSALIKKQILKLKIC
jgi:5-methylcytosine-specific restriction endonuclease McrBC GTP-binding regulatory subunit McrB